MRETPKSNSQIITLLVLSEQDEPFGYRDLTYICPMDLSWKIPCILQYVFLQNQIIFAADMLNYHILLLIITNDIL